MKRRQPRHPRNQYNLALGDDPILRKFLDDAKRYPIPDTAESAELARLAQNGDLSARNKLINGNCLLLVRIAGNLQSLNVDINDLIQEGFFGLDMAIDHYDPTLCVPFINYASWWIRKCIIQYIWRNQTIVRIPEVQRLNVNKLLRVSTHYVSEHGHVPSNEELCRLSGLSARTVRTFCGMLNGGNLRNLMEPMAVEGDGVVPCDESPDPVRMLESKEFNKGLQECIDALPPDYRELLKTLFGIDREALTASEIARMNGVTYESVRIKRVKMLDCFRKIFKERLGEYKDVAFG